MKKRLLLVLVFGLSFAQPVLGASMEDTGERGLREIKGRAATGISCKESGVFQAKNLEGDFRVEDSHKKAADAGAAL